MYVSRLPLYPTISLTLLFQAIFVLERCKLSLGAANFIAHAVSNGEPIDTVRFTFCRIPEAALIELLDSLRGQSRVRALSLSGTSFTPLALRALYACVRHCGQHLTDLNLSFCGLNGAHAKYLALALAENEGLRNVSLR